MDEGRLDRRELLGMMGAAALWPLVGCGGATAAAGGGCLTIPEETAGPFPGDGTIGANALTQSGIVRADIRPSFGTASGTAAGVPLTVELDLVAAGASCAALPGYAVYIWHCDRDGLYSLYTLPSQNYLRGVQVADAAGKVTFQSIFPGCYPGRWPHIHFEIYPSLPLISSAQNKVATSQLALPETVCRAAYAQAGYAQSATNLGGVTLATDGVFSDGWSQQIPTVTGSADAGYAIALTVPV
jgi:protocatechuate 3,4-dioxygenase beta subunit